MPMNNEERAEHAAFACDAYSNSKEGDQPCTYATEAEAQAEIDADPEFYEDFFVCRLDEIGHKTIYTGKADA